MCFISFTLHSSSKQGIYPKGYLRTSDRIRPLKVNALQAVFTAQGLQQTRCFLTLCALRLESQSYGSSVTLHFLRDPGHLWFMMFLIPPGLRNLLQTQSSKKAGTGKPSKNLHKFHKANVIKLTISVPQNLCMSTSKSFQASCVILNPCKK